MKKKILILLLVFSSIINAQTDKIKISGRVVDNAGQSIPGATITSEENSTITDFDGNYVINVKNSKSIIKYSFIGFATKTITVGNNKSINVTLVESANVLDDVVVIGYGTQKRSSVTGSVAKLKSDKFEDAPVSRLDNAIQGKIAGVRVQSISSEAGADTQINIRGISSVKAGSGPLLVVDGQPMPDGFSALNSADVESVEVLKDAASAAIYGSRGANGVILVTTKSGKEGKTKYYFRSTAGVKQAYDTYDIMSSTDYVERLYAEQAMRNADPLWTTAYGASLPSLDKWRAQYSIEKDLLGGQGTDYQKEALRKAYYQDMQFNVSGGSNKNKFFISVGYQNDQGLMLKSEFEKLNFRAKFDLQLTEKLKLNINLNPSNTKTERPAINFIDFTRFPSFIPVYHTQATADFINGQQPSRGIVVGNYAEASDFANLVYTGIDPNGVAYTTAANAVPFTTSNTNPMRALLEQDDNNNQFRFQGSAGLEYKIAKGLDFRTTENIYYRNSQRVQSGAANAARIGNPNYATYTNANYFDFLTENTLNYKKSIGNHEFGALAGFSLQSTRTKSLVTAGTTFPSDDNKNLNYATVILQPIQSDVSIGLVSFLTRVNYAYKDKYLLMGSYRTDGSSKFGDGNKWGGFPAVSAGWVISKEKFLADVSVINRMAFRASYGATGNNSIGDFMYQYYLNPSNYVSGTGNGTVTIGLANTNNINNNPDITWERTFQSNFGFDLSMFKSRLNLNIDVYQSNTEKLLLEQSSMLISGSSSVIANVGSLKNKGFEVELSTVNLKSKNFSWTSDFNIAHVKNQITNLGDKTMIISPTIDGRNGLNNYAIVGQPLISFYGFKTNGIWNSIEEITASGLTTTLTNGLKEGGLKIVDLNGDGVLDNNDRTILGNPYPDFTWGFTNKFTFKNIDLSFTLQGVVGGELINGDVNYNEPKERNLNYMANRWVSPSNPGDGKTPYTTNGYNWVFTDNAIEDASYTSLREISLGYNLGKNALKQVRLTNLRFSLSGQNLLFWNNKNYRGINIEARTSQTSALIDGYQRGGFPMQRTVLFGVEVGL
ncbi:SusC/RagA family TonB-linked outer membrane protein [Flavobacterium quisquiliarum]|uniref:SusC/RagA family TonB-linked outer membrane protein n=1 Tax=Flavobacterium quisquiliarum TaxID=1834436 RepID=A0ABV8W5E8_9FLAO|nr:TonB-dependent receptor [Flavobacterium quisquiliarum]MBW1654267.1 SusC/RagA family TonB-linked outer membrane protein [Flavobacterium quisquiliarum]NWL03310.1 SusC/RagA family TonB-linked outer membrane protein [Flavobacterium collinsii]